MSDTNRPGRDKRRHSASSTSPANLDTRSFLPPQLFQLKTLRACFAGEHRRQLCWAMHPHWRHRSRWHAVQATTRLACTHPPNGACTLARSAPSPDTSGAGRGPAALFEHSGWRRRSATPVHPVVRTPQYVTYPCNTVPYNMNHRTGTVYLYNMVPPNSLDS